MIKTVLVRMLRVKMLKVRMLKMKMCQVKIRKHHSPRAAKTTMSMFKAAESLSRALRMI